MAVAVTGDTSETLGVEVEAGSKATDPSCWDIDVILSKITMGDVSKVMGLSVIAQVMYQSVCQGKTVEDALASEKLSEKMTAVTEKMVELVKNMEIVSVVIFVTCFALVLITAVFTGGGSLMALPAAPAIAAKLSATFQAVGRVVQLMVSIVVGVVEVIKGYFDLLFAEAKAEIATSSGDQQIFNSVIQERVNPEQGSKAAKELLGSAAYAMFKNSATAATGGKI